MLIVVEISCPTILKCKENRCQVTYLLWDFQGNSCMRHNACNNQGDDSVRWGKQGKRKREKKKKIVKHGVGW